MAKRFEDAFAATKRAEPNKNSETEGFDSSDEDEYQNNRGHFEDGSVYIFKKNSALLFLKCDRANN